MPAAKPRSSRAILPGLLSLVLNACLGLPAHAAADAPPPAAAQGQADPHFDLLEFAVEGNSVLPSEDVERAVYPFLGPDHSIKDIEAARTALEAVYQARGFLTVSVDIPEQKIESGVARLRVTEGRVGRLRVTGSHYFDLGVIKERAPSVAQGEVPQFQQVQKELGELNRTPDRRVTPVLRPGKQPGTVDVDLNVVEDHLPLHGNVQLDDRYNAYTEPLRFTGSLRYDNLWQAEHSFGLTWTVAPNHSSDANVLSATYLMPMPDNNSLAIYAVHSSSDVVPAAYDTVGKGNIVGARYVIPLAGDPSLFHSFTIGVDHKQFAETLRLQGADTQNTPIT